MTVYTKRDIRHREMSNAPDAKCGVPEPSPDVQRRAAWLHSLEWTHTGALAEDAVDPDTGRVISAAEDQAKVMRDYAKGSHLRECRKCGRLHDGKFRACGTCRAWDRRRKRRK